MKRIVNELLAFSCLLLAASCADYNDLGGFTTNPDPAYTNDYAGLNSVKSYLNREAYPNMSIETSMDIKTYNKQGKEHAIAVTNFDGISFGSTFMPNNNVVSKKGYINFMAFKDAIGHAEKMGTPVYGSPICANENQPDDWFAELTAPREVSVLPQTDKDVDYSTMDEFTGTIVRDGGKNDKTKIIKNYDDDGNVLRTPIRSKVYIIEDFPADPLGFYTITFKIKPEKDLEETIQCTFADSLINTGKDKQTGKPIAKKYTVRAGGWQTIKIECVPSKQATKGYLMIEGNLNTAILIRNVHVEHTPDNHEPLKKWEKNEKIQYALNKWCDELMEANAGRIKSFDLIDKALDTKVLDGVTHEGENVLDLKHSDEKIFWQDYLEEGNKTGSELYGATVSKVAKAAFEKHGGKADELKFFVCETGLENPQRLASLKYWIGVWKTNEAKIDGINAELNFTYIEDADNETTLNNLLENLAKTGLLIRLSNFDITYQDAEGAAVTADKITKEQRQKLADYYAYVINAYMTKIPKTQQAGICKGNMFDTSSGKGDPVGLWSINDNSDWVRNATYEAFCNALKALSE